MNPLQSLPEYENFVYSLAQRYPLVQRSTLVLVRRGAAIAVFHGEIELTAGYRWMCAKNCLLPPRVRLSAMVTRSGRVIKSSTGMIRSHTQTIPLSPARIRITSISHLISSIIACQRQV